MSPGSLLEMQGLRPTRVIFVHMIDLKEGLKHVKGVAFSVSLISDHACPWLHAETAVVCTVMYHLAVGIPFEKYITFYHCVTITECAYTDLEGMEQHVAS